MFKNLTFLVGIILVTIVSCAPLPRSSSSEFTFEEDEYKDELRVELIQHFAAVHNATISFKKAVKLKGKPKVSLNLRIELTPIDKIESTFYFNIDGAIIKAEFNSLQLHDYLDSERHYEDGESFTTIHSKVMAIGEFAFSESLIEQLLSAKDVTIRTYINSKPENYILAGKSETNTYHSVQLVLLQKFLRINDRNYKHSHKTNEIYKRARAYQKKI